MHILRPPRRLYGGPKSAGEEPGDDAVEATSGAPPCEAPDIRVDRMAVANAAGDISVATVKF